jgi:hypothetical protein
VETLVLATLDFGLVALVDLEVSAVFVGEMRAGDGGAACDFGLEIRGRKMDRERKRFIPLGFEGVTATPSSWEEGMGAKALADRGP